MTLALEFPTPAAPMSGVPALAQLARIADEVELADGVLVAGELVHGRFLTTALADSLYVHYFRDEPRIRGSVDLAAGRRGDVFCRRLADALRPELLRRDGWRFSYRTTAGAPSFVVSAGGPDSDAASCYLHLHPGTAPESFARLVSALDGYGVGFRAELAGDPAACLRADSAVVTVRREDAPTVARVALRLQQRAPFALAPSVPVFARRLAPGVAIADEPGTATRFGRHRCRLVAAGLVAAGPGAGPVARRAAVLQTLTAVGLDPAALHLNPGNREFRV